MIAHLALALSLTTQPPDKWFGGDKLKHFFMAAFTQSVAYSALQAARVRHDQALAGAWAVTATVSVAKEIHDRRSYGLFSVRDLVWDAAERLEARWGREWGRVEFGTEDVPPSDPSPWERGVPLGRLFPADLGQTARIVLYRRPIEQRDSSPGSN